jgi:hypothetical protein
MISSQALGAGVLGVVVSTSAVQEQTAAHDRDIRLGGDLASVSALTGVAASEAKTLHAREAILQELQWRRAYALTGEMLADPVQQIAFSFYNDQLFRLVIDYDHDGAAGLTDADMVEAISTKYGTPVNPGLKPTRVPLATIEGDSGTRVANWGNVEYAAVLYRSSFASGFRLVITSVRLNALAEAETIRLDARRATA